MFKRKHYKFTDRKSSKRGMASTLLLFLAIVMIIYGIFLSFQAHGNGDIMVGVYGFGGFVTAITGFFLGLNSLKDEDVFHTFSWIGSVGNAIICFFVMIMIMIGI